jgi:TatD DNase family protein
MLFDSHAHINSERYNVREREKVIEAIEKSNLSYVMDVGYDLESSVMAVKHAERYPWCYAVIGCHPHDTKTMDEATLSMFKGLAKKPKVKAIGEIGLDFYYNHSERDVQEYWFRRQAQLAVSLDMPIVIHDRDANDEVMRILKEEGVFGKARVEKLGDAKLLMHCFSGSRELAASTSSWEPPYPLPDRSPIKMPERLSKSCRRSPWNVCSLRRTRPISRRNLCAERPTGRIM